MKIVTSKNIGTSINVGAADEGDRPPTSKLSWPYSDERNKKNLISVNEATQQELYEHQERQSEDERKQKIKKFKRISIWYNPILFTGFIVIYWFTGLRQYNLQV